MAFEKSPQFEGELNRKVMRGLHNAGLRATRSIRNKMSNQPPRTGNLYYKVRGSGGTELAVEGDDGELLLFRWNKATKSRILVDFNDLAGVKLQRGGVHIASAEGEPPALLTGTLARRVSYRVDESEYRVYFGSNATEDGFNYPKHLAEKMKRTGYREALDEDSREIMQAFRDGARRG